VETTVPATRPTVVLRLFVAGSSPRSRAAVARVEELRDRVDAELSFEIVDVLEQPDVADEHSVLATPTLVRLAPEPEYRLIGDLSRADDLLRYLLPDHPIS
jgi:circadian clock protein KaiB